MNQIEIKKRLIGQTDKWGDIRSKFIKFIDDKVQDLIEREFVIAPDTAEIRWNKPGSSQGYYIYNKDVRNVDILESMGLFSKPGTVPDMKDPTLKETHLFYAMNMRAHDYIWESACYLVENLDGENEPAFDESAEWCETCAHLMELRDQAANRLKEPEVSK